MEINEKMTNLTVDKKATICQNLDDFTNNVDICIKGMCNALGWNFENVNKYSEPYIKCPFNEGHDVPERSIEKHLESCEWSVLGYTKHCKPLPESSVPIDSPSNIKMDMGLQHKILQEAKRKNPLLKIGNEERLIPQTSDRLLSDFTSDERRVLYDYVTANTLAPDNGQDIPDINNKSKEETPQSTPILELLAQERNLRRRRTKHRGVHTNKKSHTEIMREVVEKQMEMYKEYISEKHGLPAPADDDSSYRSHSDNEKMKPKSERSNYDKNEDYNENGSEYSSKSYRSKSSSKNYDRDHRYDKYRDNEYRNSYRSSRYDRDSYSHSYNRKQYRNDYYDNNAYDAEYYDDDYDSSESSGRHRKSHKHKRSRSRSRDRRRRKSSRSKSRERSRHKKHKKKSRRDSKKDDKSDSIIKVKVEHENENEKSDS